MEDHQRWLCKLCTNVNASTHATCSICGVPRPCEDEASTSAAFSQNQIVSARPKTKGQQRRKQIDPEQQQHQRLLEVPDVYFPVAQVVGTTATEYKPPTRKVRSPSRRAISTGASRPNRSELSAADKYDIVDQAADPYALSSASPAQQYAKMVDDTKPRASESNRQFAPQQQRTNRSNSAKMADDHQSMPENENKNENETSRDDGNTTTEEKSTLVATEDPGPESEFRRSYYKAKSSTRRMSQRSGNDPNEGLGDSNIVQKDPPRNHSNSSDEDDDSMTYRTEDSYDTFSTYSSFGMSASFDQNNETAIEAVRLERLARLLSPSWFGKYDFSPAYAQRLVSFKYAQQKRREVYGFESPWGIMGLYEHLSAIRNDIKWAEEVERRKEYGLPHISWSDFDSELDSIWNTPIFTYVLMFVCTGLLVVSIWLNDWKFEPMSSNPTFGPSAEVLLALGAKDSNLIVNEGEPYRLVTPMFLHAGVIHYLINMMALNAIGRAVEQSHGSMSAFFMFFVPAVGGTIISAIMLPQYISVGASGGIFGLMGACIADICLHWSLLFSNIVNGPGGICRHFFVVVILFLDIAVNCLIGLTPFVDNWTHMGGMVFGMLCAFISMNRVRFSPTAYKRSCCRDSCLPFLAALLTFGSLLASGIVLFTGDGYTAPCSMCQKLSCVEFPPWKNSTSKWWYCDNCGMASADAHIDDESGYYDYLNMLCPDGNTVTFDLGDDATSDSTEIQSKLDYYCRLNCDDSSYVY